MLRTLIVIAFLLLPSIALADIAPPPDSGDRDAGAPAETSSCAASPGTSGGLAWAIVPLAFGIAIARRRR